MKAGLSHEQALEAARAELRRAQALQRARPREALGHLREGLRLDPRDAEMALHAARVEARLALYSDALESLRRFQALAGPHGEALALAALCHLRLGDRGRSQERARASLALLGTNAMAREILSDCLREQGAWFEASQELRTLLAARTTKRGVRLRLELKLAECLLRLGDPAAAWRIARGLMRSGHGDARARAILDESEAMERVALRKTLGSGPFRTLLFWAAGPRLLRILLAGRKTNLGREAERPEPLSGRRP